MDDVNNQILTDTELDQIVAGLQKLQPGFVPFALFLQLSRLMVLPIVELVPLRKSADGHIEVLLLSRGPDDPIWPNELHTPGTVLRAYDYDDPSLPMRRIVNDELQGTKISKPVFVTNSMQKSKRGVEQAQIYVASVQGEPKVGSFYQVDALPASLMQSQKAFIEAAVTAFQQ